MSARAKSDTTPRTVGVEEELLLVGRDQHTAIPSGERVVDEAEARESGHPVEHEFKQEQIEIASDPHTDLTKVLDDLIGKRRTAIEVARAEGVEVAALATSPGKVRPRGTRNERYERMVAEFGLLAAEQLTCGQHIHVAVSDRAEGVAVLDRIRGWLPVLLALSSNSPFWQDQDTGYASFRSVLWGRWPSAGPTALFRDETSYDAALHAQLVTGSALDDGMIYFDARLSATYPTVEIRVADVCTDVRDAVLLAALARGLVEAAARRRDEPPLPIEVAVLRAASWRAARWGMTGTLIDPRTGTQEPASDVAAALLDWIGPDLSADDRQFVQVNLDRIKRDGTGAAQQRAVFDRTQSLDDVVADAVRRTAAG